MSRLHYTPESDEAFRKYGAAAEVKAMAQRMVRDAKNTLKVCEGSLGEELEHNFTKLREHVAAFVDMAITECERLRPAETLEQRGYDPVKRGVAGAVYRCPKCDGCKECP
jgi:hypothetical protein